MYERLHELYVNICGQNDGMRGSIEAMAQWVLTKCSIFGNCKVNDIYDPKVYILGSHNQLKMNFYHCKHFHKSRFTFFGNFAYVILESVNFKMIFQPSSGLRWLSG